MTISFALVQCTCGAERQAEQSCPHCGRRPGEVDEDLARRRAIVAALEARDPVGDVAPLTLDDAFGAVGGWFDVFAGAYERTAEGSVDQAAARLRAAFDELDTLHERARRAIRLRPNKAAWSALDGVLAAFDDVRDTYLAALVAPTVPAAEKAANRGQAAIDTASAALDHFHALAGAWESVTDADLADEHADLHAGAESIVALSGTRDMIGLDREGAELFARIADDIVCPSGFGLRLKLLDLAVQGSMDPARFWAVARRIYGLLAGYDVALRGVFADETWRRDFVALSLEARDAGFEAAAVAAASGNRRRMVQSALRLAARQIERVAQPLLATVLSLHGRQPYTAECRRDINALLTRAAQAGFNELLAGLDPKLRDADAHGQFVIDERGVRLTGTRGRLDYLTDDELVDTTLAGTESITAIYWGIVAALVAAGVNADKLDEAVAAEVNDADRVKFVLLLNGWHDVEVELADGALTARGRRDGANAWGLIGAVVSVVGDDVATITLAASDETGTHTASGPVAPFRRWSEGDDELEKEIAFTRASMAWTVDGKAVFSREQTEKVYAYRSIEALNPGVPAGEALATLRRLLDAARAIESDVALAICAALRLRREVAMGVQPTQGVDDVVPAFDRWLLRDVPEPRSGW